LKADPFVSILYKDLSRPPESEDGPCPMRSTASWRRIRPTSATSRTRCARSIASVTPDADEYLKLGWKVIWYGFGPQMPDQFAVVMPTRNHVGLGSPTGPTSGPEGKLEGTGKRMRHVKLRTAADAEDPAIAALLRAQVALLRAERAAPKGKARPKASKKKAAARPKARKKVAARRKVRKATAR
jgi:hypothetical protein